MTDLDPDTAPWRVTPAGDGPRGFHSERGARTYAALIAERSARDARPLVEWRDHDGAYYPVGGGIDTSRIPEPRPLTREDRDALTDIRRSPVSRVRRPRPADRDPA